MSIDFTHGVIPAKAGIQAPSQLVTQQLRIDADMDPGLRRDDVVIVEDAE